MTGDRSLSDGTLRKSFYEITEEELNSATIFVPGLPDPDDVSAVSHESLTAETTFSLMDIVIFFDWQSHNEVDSTQCNQWAFVVDDKQALYIRGKVHSLPLTEIHKLDYATVIHRIPEALATLVAPVLLKFRNNPMMFQVVVNHMFCNNYGPIIEQEFFPPDVKNYACDVDYNVAWNRLVSVLEPRDIIFTYDRKSVISRLIAHLTHGPFSHCAVHAENGVIWEIVTSGTRMVNIEVYRGRQFRVAVYRHYGKAPDTIEEMLSRMKASDGQPGYSYYGAIRAGIKAYFGRHVEAMTPNSLILTGALTFVAQA